MIIVRLKGGMGNQMFQYAIGRALSLKNKTSMGLDLAFLLDRTPQTNFTFRNYDLDIFNISPKIISQKNIHFLNKKIVKNKIDFYIQFFLKNIFKNLGEEKNFSFDPNVFSLGSNIYLDGYWQSPKYFSEIEDIIRKDFSFKDKLSDKIKDIAKEIKNQNSLCIHVRRGDFVGDSHCQIINKDYYDKGIDYISKIIKIDKIYVFSDDIEWCKENLSFEFPIMFVENTYSGEKGEGHLFLMSCCKYFIIANSTFSWWGAWLSYFKDKIVIAPKQWFRDKDINTDGLIPKEWIRI